jgi:hypothetical protein
MLALFVWCLESAQTGVIVAARVLVLPKPISQRGLQPLDIGQILRTSDGRMPA